MTNISLIKANVFASFKEAPNQMRNFTSWLSRSTQAIATQMHKNQTTAIGVISTVSLLSFALAALFVKKYLDKKMADVSTKDRVYKHVVLSSIVSGSVLVSNIMLSKVTGFPMGGRFLAILATSAFALHVIFNLSSKVETPSVENPTGPTAAPPEGPKAPPPPPEGGPVPTGEPTGEPVAPEGPEVEPAPPPEGGPEGDMPPPPPPMKSKPDASQYEIFNDEPKEPETVKLPGEAGCVNVDSMSLDQANAEVAILESFIKAMDEFLKPILSTFTDIEKMSEEIQKAKNKQKKLSNSIMDLSKSKERVEKMTCQKIVLYMKSGKGYAAFPVCKDEDFLEINADQIVRRKKPYEERNRRSAFLLEIGQVIESEKKKLEEAKQEIIALEEPLLSIRNKLGKDDNTVKAIHAQIDVKKERLVKWRTALVRRKQHVASPKKSAPKSTDPKAVDANLLLKFPYIKELEQLYGDQNSEFSIRRESADKFFAKIFSEIPEEGE